METLEEILRSLIEPMINFPEDLEIRVIEIFANTYKVELNSHSDDNSKLRGTGHKTACSFKFIAEAICRKRDSNFVGLQVLEPKTGEKLEVTPMIQNPAWQSEWLKQLIGQTLAEVLCEPFALAVKDEGSQTYFNAVISEREARRVKGFKLARALTTIVHAIGKANGRECFFILSEN